MRSVAETADEMVEANSLCQLVSEYVDFVCDEMREEIAEEQDEEVNADGDGSDKEGGEEEIVKEERKIDTRQREWNILIVNQ